MKKTLIIIGIVVVTLLVIGYLSMKPFQKWILKRNINKVAVEYVKDVLLVQDFDSIKIVKFDSLSDMGFAKLSLEMLEEMKTNYDYLYQDALVNAESDVVLDQLTYQIKLIEVEMAQQYNIANNNNTNTKNLKNYLVYAFYYKKGVETPILFLTTPDGKYFDFNLFKE
ncbi:MAG TPA: hypothetical protein PLI77_06570 [Bacteroidales bacterium]|nr:hypothetical protein [Bacteroidales bacterium]